MAPAAGSNAQHLAIDDHALPRKRPRHQPLLGIYCHAAFAYLVAVRFDLDSHGRLLELGIHHWSNFWIKQPNRGQDFLTLSFGF